MPRKGRRDCRKSETKKNHMNIRVEALQQSIRKNRKAALAQAKAGNDAPSTNAAAADAAAAPAASAASAALTPAAAAFLSQMRADVTAELSAGRKADQADQAAS